jgi:phasin family protein
MVKTPEDFQKLQAEAFKAGTAAFEQAYKGAQKLAELNVESARAMLAASTERVRTILSAKDPQSLASMFANAGQTSPEPFATYAKDVYAIANETFTAMRALAEQRVSDAQKTFVTAMEAALANAPAGSEATVSFVRSAMDAANKAYAQAIESNTRLFDLAEANLAGATKAAAASAAAAAGGRKKG